MSMSIYRSLVAGFDPIGVGVCFEQDGGAGGAGDQAGDDGGAGGDGNDPGNDGGDNGDDPGGGDTSWRDTITDEKLQGIASRYNSPADMAQAVLNFRQKLSKSISIPGEDASEDDVKAFRKAMGVPESVDGYEFAMPEGVEATDADKEFHGKLAEMFHKNNVPLSMAKGLNELWNEMTVEMENQQIEADKAFVDETDNALKTKWGQDYERNKELSSRAAKYLFGDNLDAATQIEMKGGRFLLDHPVMMEALAKAGAEMSEDGFERLDENAVAGIKDQIKEVRAEINKAMNAGNTKLANDLSAKERALYEKIGSGQSS